MKKIILFTFIILSSYSYALAQKKKAKPPHNIIYDFSSIDVLPEFRGGIAGWGEYLQKNLRYPATASEKNISGRVTVQFVIEKDGRVTDIKVLRGIGGGCDEEAIRVLKTAPKWKPGIHNGKPVRVSYVLPIAFVLG